MAEPAHATFRWRPRQVARLLTKSAQEWVEDKSPRQAAALAYYALFALGPLLLIATSLAGLAFGHEATRRAVTGQIGGLVGEEGARAVEGMMAGGVRGGAGAVGLAVGSVVLLFGAVGVFAQLRSALNRTWEIEEKAVAGWRRKVATAVRRNLLGFAGVAGVGFLLLVSLLINTAITALAGYAQGVLPGAEWLWRGVTLLFTLAIVATLFALMFKLLPNARVAWGDVLVGAAATSVLFVAGEALIGAYLGQGTVAERYGAAGAVVAILLWVYYSSLIVLYSAELTQVYANTYGSRIRPSRHGEPIQEAIAKRDSPPHVEGTEAKPGKQPQRRDRPARRGRAPARGPAARQETRR